MDIQIIVNTLSSDNLGFVLYSHREVARDFNQGERDKLAKTGAAMPDGSFPIKNASDLKNAVRLAGKAKDPAAAKAHIRKRAKALGLSDAIPSDWA